MVLQNLHCMYSVDHARSLIATNTVSLQTRPLCLAWSSILQTKNYFKVGTVHGVGDRETKIPLDIQGAVWDGAKVRGECTSIGLCIELGVFMGKVFVLFY